MTRAVVEMKRREVGRAVRTNVKRCMLRIAGAGKEAIGVREKVEEMGWRGGVEV